MWRSSRGLIWSVLMLIPLAGCATTGFVDGRFSAAGNPPVPITFVYKTQPFGEGGTMTVDLPTGESFSGKYVQITSTSTADVVHPLFWEPIWDDWGPFGAPWYEGTDFPTLVRNYTGKVVATLFGDRGDTMRCRFQLSSPEQGMSGGGVGECQVSNGGKIAATF
jgi:hypothetical protein